MMNFKQKYIDSKKTQRSLVLQPLIILFISLLLSSCEYILDLNRDGDTITKEYELSSFSTMSIKAPYKVVLIQDTITKAEVEGLDYLLEDVEITQESSTLILNHNSPNLISESKLPEVRVHSPSFNSIIVDAAGKLIADTITQTSFSLQLLAEATYNNTDINLNVSNFTLSVYYYNNIGTMNFSGKANYASFWVSGSTEVNANTLETKKMYFKMMSAVDCSVSVSDVLDLDIYCCGDVLLYGNPEVTVEKISNNILSPTGELIYMEE